MTEAAPSPPTADILGLAEDLEAIRRRVLNVVGHELRTPVTTIHGLAEAVCAAPDLATVTDELGPALLRNTERLQGLLDDLLVASGIRTAIPVDDPAPVDLAALVHEWWAGKGPLTVEGEGRVSAPPEVLRRLLGAIMDNALAYGEAAPTVLLSGDDVVEVVVRSPGSPIHPEEVRLATEPFFRGERAVSTRPGLGLGLAIARQLAEHLGGELTFATEPGGHITTVRLPRGARS